MARCFYASASARTGRLPDIPLTPIQTGIGSAFWARLWHVLLYSSSLLGKSF